jgi:hypothetical protein
MTECAFVRIISNPAFSPDSLTPKQALALLGANLKHPTHHFWPDDISLLESLEGVSRALPGITSLPLYRTANSRRYASTLDRAIKSFARAGSSRVELIQ